MNRKRPEELRSHRWLGVSDLRSFGHRSRLRQFGYDAEDWGGRPVIGIINTWSEINACHAHLRTRAENVKRGVLQAGGFPIELPAMSLAEPFVKPSTMLYRNFLAMVGTAGVFVPAECETNSRFSSGVLLPPKTRESMSESKVNIT